MQRTHLHEAGKDQPVRGELGGPQAHTGSRSHPCQPELPLADDPAITRGHSVGTLGSPHLEVVEQEKAAPDPPQQSLQTSLKRMKLTCKEVNCAPRTESSSLQRLTIEVKPPDVKCIMSKTQQKIT